MSPGDLFVDTFVEGFANVIIGIFNGILSALNETVLIPFLEQLVEMLGITMAA